MFIGLTIFSDRLIENIVTTIIIIPKTSITRGTPFKNIVRILSIDLDNLTTPVSNFIA